MEAYAKYPEPVYRHGLKIRITPKLIYKDVSEVSFADVSSSVALESEESITEYLLENKDRQYYTDVLEAENKLLLISENHENPIYISINSLANSRTGLLITAKPNTSATVIVLLKSHAEYVAQHIHCIAQENASVKIIVVQSYGENTASFIHCGAKLYEAANVEWTSVLTGSGSTYFGCTNVLLGDSARGTITGLYLASHEQRYDIDTVSIHKNKNTFSNILTKGAINHTAKALSRGLVRIEENAFGSNGYEKQDALLLSRTAEADAIPNLEIHNHDVKCSHGSTIGKVNEAQLFYLMSRGICEKDAIDILVTGFFNPVIEQLDAQMQKLVIETIRGGL